MKREQRLVDLKIEQSGKPTSEKMTSHGSVSDLPADIVSVDRVLIRLEIISTVILLHSAESFKKGCCQLQAKSMCTKYWLTTCSSMPRTKVWLGELTVLP